MRYLKTSFLTLIVLSGVFSALVGQEANRALVSFNNDRVFVGVTNFFRVVAQQPGTVRLEQLSATLQTYGEEEPAPIVLEIKQNENRFTIHPEDIGIVSITIQLEDRHEQHSFHTKQLDAVARIGGERGGLVSAIVLKAQKGIYANIEGYDYCGNCKIISYEIIRITPDRHVEMVTNNGSYWELEAAELIGNAQPGDRYIFDKIVYRCFGNVKNQLAEIMSFELK